MKWIILFTIFLLSLARPPPRLSSNYNESLASEFALISPVLEVPNSLPRHTDPLGPTPLNEKYNIGHYEPTIAISDMPWEIRKKMTAIDHEMLQDDHPPHHVFTGPTFTEYQSLESREFEITMANPSELMTICINDIFADCDGLKKSLRRVLPFCLNPYTKYPLHFTLYITHQRNRDLLNIGIFLNVTFMANNQPLKTRIWMHNLQITFLPNHLRLAPLELKHCSTENSFVQFKNHEKQSLSFLLIYKHKKYQLNGKSLDDRITIPPGKTFRFMIEGRDSTMTIYTKTVETSDRIYPVLYLPIYCVNNLTIDHIPVGLINKNDMALSYPIVVTSHTAFILNIEEISLSSSSGTVELIRHHSHRSFVKPHEKYIQIGSFVVRARREPKFKNSLNIKVRYSFDNTHNRSESSEASRHLTYSELYNCIDMNDNHRWDVSQISPTALSESDRKLLHNHAVTNHLKIPVKMEKIHLANEYFRLNWLGITGQYIMPNRSREEILLEYIGDPEIMISPMRYVAVVEFSGNIFMPFEMKVHDNDLTCGHNGRDVKCTKLKSINFGHRNEEKTLRQTITIKNFNPKNITFMVRELNYTANRSGLSAVFWYSDPYPYYSPFMIPHPNIPERNKLSFLRSGHIVNLTIEIKLLGKPVSGELEMYLESDKDLSAMILLKYNFEEDQLMLSPNPYQIDQFDIIHQGELVLMSSYQEEYSIKEIITNTNTLIFHHNSSIIHTKGNPVTIPFTFDPSREDNITDQCCGENHLKSHYINDLIKFEDSDRRNYEVTLITTTDLEQKIEIQIGSDKKRLLRNHKNGKILLKGLKVSKGSQVALKIHNPYAWWMKYELLFLKEELRDKPKDYINYFRYARKEKVDGYFCHKNGMMTPTGVRNMLHLEEQPLELILHKDENGKVVYPPSEAVSLSSNQYVLAMARSGRLTCFKISTVLFIKLLIESEIVNHLLETHHVDEIRSFMERELQHVHEGSILLFNDHYYHKFPQVNFEAYCNSVFFPIFRFCQSFPLAHGGNRPKGRYDKNNGYLIAPNSTSVVSLDISARHENKVSFSMVIANNISKYDEYEVELELLRPKLALGKIAFEENSKIDRNDFMRHYFPQLYKMNHPPVPLSKVIPLIFTKEDFDSNFQLFRGSRYFEITNEAELDVEFTHFGFQNQENISVYDGLEIEQQGRQPTQPILLPSNSKSTFKLSFRLDLNFNFNMTNPLFNQKIHLYLYQGTQYYLEVIVLIRITDPVAVKIAELSKQEPPKQRLSYIVINLVSVGFVCVVVLGLKKEERERSAKIKATVDKQKKIGTNKERKEMQQNEDNMDFKRKHVILSPAAIGSPIDKNNLKTYKPICLITEEELSFFKTLKIKEEPNPPSESSEERLLRNSEEYSERNKEEEDKSYSYSRERIDQDESRNSEVISMPSNEDQPEPENDMSESSEEESSHDSLSESILPDGISVAMDKLADMDDFDEGFGFESEKKMTKKKGQEEVVYYDVFSSANPLKKEQNPFPWMGQDKKKSKGKTHRH